MARTSPWKVSDELWERVEPLIPPAPSPAKGDCPRTPDQQAFEAIVYVLRTSIQWNALPRELGVSSIVHDCFQRWKQKGRLKALWQAGLHDYDEVQGIEWEWQAVDGVITKTPFGKGATDGIRTGRAESGTKRSMLTDGEGIPLVLVVEGANRQDCKLLCATLDGIVTLVHS